MSKTRINVKDVVVEQEDAASMEKSLLCLMISKRMKMMSMYEFVPTLKINDWNLIKIKNKIKIHQN